MIRNILDIDFPSGVKHLYMNGRRYTKKDFLKARALEKRRGKKGRFISLNKL
ncbi:MAG: hypothetical protein P8L83_00990 [Flavobacteriaceae bacterium]|nr:hypothetical protein [Flavobacteriaceae bacterium]